MSSLIARLHSLLRGIRRGERLNDDMEEEFRLHIALRAEDLVRDGMTPAEAARQARLEFGSTESFKDRGRDARGLRIFDSVRFSLLDLKLGGRMLVKHPALTVIGTIAVAFAIAIGTVAFEIARQALFPSIPLPDANAIVALRNWNVVTRGSIGASRRDYTIWKSGLTRITDIGAIVLQDRNIAVGTGAGEPVTVADVTASTFAMTRVPALMGRTLLEADERPDAQDVVVVGYDFWQNKLGGATDVVGRIIHVSGTPFTIIGVMPRRYGFPKRNGVWRPLHLDRLPETSPRLFYVFGRVAQGHTRDEASAEFVALGARTAATFPETHHDLRAQIIPLPDAVSSLPAAASIVLASINIFLVLLIALVCGNVALLLFARATSRQTEIVIRAALGASRGRIITQLFAEALVLCAAGAIVGLVVANFAIGWTWTMIEGQKGDLPFWITTSLSASTVAYALGLTVFAAAIAGVVPAVKVTSGGVDARLRAASSGGGGIQFGGVWTGVIVAQIALTTLLPLPLGGVREDFVHARDVSAGFEADAFLTATLGLDRLDGAAARGDTLPAARATRFETRYETLADRLRREPGVLGVTYASELPLMYHGARTIELDPGPAAPRSPNWCTEGYCAAAVSIDPRFFDVIGAPVRRGRSLTLADADQNARSVLVNEFFVNQVLDGRNPIGRQIRFLSPPGRRAVGKERPEPWLQIVGVVPDLGLPNNPGDLGRARIYRATLPKDAGPLHLAIHLRADPERFAPRLRELAQAVDPSLRVIDPKPLSRVFETEVDYSAFWYHAVIVLTIVTLLLSLSGVYAVTAFAVARRTREIGVRIALGARPKHVLVAVFKRPAIQIALGIGVGAIMALVVGAQATMDVRGEDFARTAICVLSTAVCCGLACIVPTRRALRIQPTEALKDEG
jgi:putative ABC transport system permease protein